MGGSVSTNHKSSNRIELSWFGQHFEKNFVFWPDPTHQPTHLTMHQPMGRGVSTDFKSSNRIEISQLVQVLLNFDWFQGFPGEGVGGCGCKGALSGERVPQHMCTCMCMHICTCAYDIIGNSQGFPQWGRPFAWNYHVYDTCMYMRMCMCMHVCAHVWRHPPNHPHCHPPTPYPQSCREPKSPKVLN